MPGLPFEVGEQVRVRQVGPDEDGFGWRSDFAQDLFEVTKVERDGRGKVGVRVKPLPPTQHVADWNSFDAEDLEAAR